MTYFTWTCPQISNCPRFFNHPLVMSLAWRLLKCDWTHYCGALPSYSAHTSGGSEFGPWHRDTYSLFQNEEQDAALPPFYLTLIVPLQVGSYCM